MKKELEFYYKCTCDDCGSNHDISVYFLKNNDIIYQRPRLCSDCADKLEESFNRYKFSELSDKAKGYAVYEYIFSEGTPPMTFDTAWQALETDNPDWEFTEEGELIEDEE